MIDPLSDDEVKLLRERFSLTLANFVVDRDILLRMLKTIQCSRAAGMERAAEIVTTYTELDSPLWRNVTAVAASAIRREIEK